MDKKILPPLIPSLTEGDFSAGKLKNWNRKTTG